MDTLTHALSGALVARATAGAAPAAGSLTLHQRMAAALLAGAFPDCDFALRLVDTLTYLNLHRGVTHSIVMLPVWTLALSWLFAWIFPGSRSWRAYVEPVALGISAHIAGDVITSYGTMIFAPVSARQVIFPFTFIIDPWFTGIIIAGLIFSALSQKDRTLATAFLAALVAYVGFQALLHERAVDIGKAHAAAREMAGASVTALPQPLSPFNWKIIVAYSEGYEETRVSLARSRAPENLEPDAGVLRRISAGYPPVAEARWIRRHRYGESEPDIDIARQAWSDPALAAFRRFAAFPALDGIDRGPQETCVWFVDLRFTLPGVPPSFRYGACRHDAGRWTLRQWSGSFLID